MFHRSRLISLLESSEKDRDIVILISPSGSGKTLLVKEYLSRKELPCLWYDLQEADSDPVVFFNSLLRNLQGFAEGFSFPPFNTSYLPAEALLSYTAKLFEALSRHVGKFNIVFDDGHTLREGSPTWKVLGYLMRAELYERLLLISRRPMPTPSEWSVEKRVLRLTFDHMGVREEEAEEILKTLYPNLTKEEIKDIYLSSGGVIAQLKIGAELRRRRRGEQVYELKKLFLPQEMKVLAKYAYIRNLSPELVDEEDRKELIGLLERLADKRLLVNRHGGGYILHDLLRSFVKQNAREVLGNDYSRTLSSMANKLARIGRTEEAIYYLLEAGEFREAFELLKAEFLKLFFSERYLSVMSFLDRLEPFYSEDPWFKCFKGACIKLLRPSEAIDLLEDAYYSLKRGGDHEGAKLALANLFNAIQYHGEDFGRVARHLEEVEKMDIELNSMVDILLVSYAGILYMLARGESKKAAELLKKGVSSLKTDRRYSQLLSYLYIYLAVALNSSGRPMEAEEFYLKAEEIYKEAPENPAGNAMYEFFASFHNIFLGRFDTAIERLERAIEYAKSWGLNVQVSHLSYKLLEAYLGKGYLRKADRLVESLSPAVGSWNTFSKGIFYQLLAQKCLMEGKLPQALLNSERALGLLESLSAYIFYRRTKGLNAFIKGLAGNPSEAKRTLEVIAADAKRDGATMQRITALFYLSYLERGENPQRAKTYLEEALRLSGENNIKSFYNIYPRLASDIYAHALEENIEPEFVKELIKFYDLPPPSDPKLRKHWPWKLRIECFGGFRIRVEGRDISLQDLGGKKPLNLLYALLALGGQSVQEGSFKDMLWESSSTGKFLKNLEFNLRRIRKFFESKGLQETAIFRKSGQMSLNTEIAWCDVMDAYQALEHIKNYALSGDSVRETEAIKSFVELYRGELLPSCSEPWIEPFRKSFREAFIDYGEKLISELLKREDWHSVVIYADKILNVYPDLESVKQMRDTAIQRLTC